MNCFATRSHLDRRTLLTRIHYRLQVQVAVAESLVVQVWYHTLCENEIGVQSQWFQNDFSSIRLGQPEDTDSARFLGLVIRLGVPSGEVGETGFTELNDVSACNHVRNGL